MRTPPLRTPYCSLPRPEVQDVDVGAQPDVVGQVVAGVVRVVIEDDVVRVPVPAVTVAEISRRHGEEEAAEPEARRTASAQVEGVARAEAAAKTAVLPGMVDVIAGIATSAIVPNPPVVIDMRGVGMSWLVVKVAILRVAGVCMCLLVMAVFRARGVRMSWLVMAILGRPPFPCACWSWRSSGRGAAGGALWVGLGPCDGARPGL